MGCMNMNKDSTTPNSHIIAGLSAPSSSTRLRAALAAGTHPDAQLLKVLVERSAVEPDFFVRDMLTWVLTRLTPEDVVPELIGKLGTPYSNERPFAQSQALHTLSKINDPALWPVLKSHADLLHAPQTEVALAAWRTAVGLVSSNSAAEDFEEEIMWLAQELVGELGRGTAETQRSLSRALLQLAELPTGESSVEELLESVGSAPTQIPETIAHAQATLELIEDPEGDFLCDLDAARRVAALGSD